MLVNIRPVESTLQEGDVGVANNVGVKNQLDYKPNLIRIRKEAESNLGITWYVGVVGSLETTVWVNSSAVPEYQPTEQAWFCYSCPVQKRATSETTSTE